MASYSMEPVGIGSSYLHAFEIHLSLFPFITG